MTTPPAVYRNDYLVLAEGDGRKVDAISYPGAVEGAASFLLNTDEKTADVYEWDFERDAYELIAQLTIEEKF